MARSRFVLRYRGQGVPPAADVTRVSSISDAVVVASTHKMLLVESEPEPLQALVDGLDGWVMAPERAFLLPDTRKRAERPPGAIDP